MASQPLAAASVASEAAEAAGREGAHAAQRLVDEQLHGGLLVLEGVHVVTCVVRHKAGAPLVAEAALGREAPLAGAKHLVLEALRGVTKGVLVTY